MTKLDHHTGKSAAKWMMRLVAHGLGVSMVAVGLWLPFLNSFTFEVVVQSFYYSGFVESSWLGLGFHLLLAGCLWALAVILFEIVTGRRKLVQKALRLSRGSVMTETLIVLPILLLLTFGIAQLVINNISGVLANAAAFQAGRTYWLWAGEADGGRSGVSKPMALEKARAQAAAVMTPVAPSEFYQDTGGLSQIATQTRGIMMGSQRPSFTTDGGSLGMSYANSLMLTNNTGVAGEDSNFVRALGTSSWPVRTARQYTFAYHASDVEAVSSAGEVGIELRYSHQQVFPLVSRIFGDPDTIGGRPGMYSVITRQFTMPTQIPPNPRTP